MYVMKRPFLTFPDWTRRHARGTPVVGAAMPNPDDGTTSEPWHGSLLRSLFCAAPRKATPEGRSAQSRLTHIPQGGFEQRPIGRPDDFDAMRRHMAALDSEIAGLRHSLGQGRHSAGSVGTPADQQQQPQQQPTTPAAAPSSAWRRGSHDAPHSARTPSTPLPAASPAGTASSANVATTANGPSPPLSERAAAAYEELSRGFRRAMARVTTPSSPAYGSIGGGASSSSGGAVGVLLPPTPHALPSSMASSPPVTDRAELQPRPRSHHHQSRPFGAAPK